MCEPAGRGCLKYTYGGVVFIYNPKAKKEVTSYPARDPAMTTSGTRYADPVFFPKVKEFESEKFIERHNRECDRIFQQKEKWTSHSVLVVDMSGSMRRDDVNGARCRSDGVWMVLAQDFVKRQLDNNLASLHDLVSVIVMQEQAVVIVKCEPMDWVLYNKLLDFREWTTFRPNGHGHYMPALEKAEHLLDLNPMGSCSLSLMFFSDGKPSDRGNFAERMGQIAAKYRRRLTVMCTGMASELEESFETLNEMVKEAESYGAMATFNKPSLSTDSLSNIMTSLVSSLATSKTELTDMHTGNSRAVRMDVTRERTGAPDDLALTDDWQTFRNSSDSHYVRRVWSWSYEKGNFVMLMDPRCIKCYKVVGTPSFDAHPSLGVKCPNCQACFVCFACERQGKLDAHCKSPDCQEWLEDRRRGSIIPRSIPSFSVGMKNQIFGEGVERIVHKFRYLSEDDKFIGPKMVAKESRFVEEHGSYRQRMDYMSEFMQTSAIASEFATKFNRAIDSLTGRIQEPHAGWIKKLPRIRFLEPLAVECIAGRSKSGKRKEFNILIEELLEGKYEKYNDNMGMVKGQARCVENDKTRGVVDRLGSLRTGPQQPAIKIDLGAIQEEDSGSGDEDDSSEEESEDSFHWKVPAPAKAFAHWNVKDENFPQAFSHFTYEESKKHLMVVDLQGVFIVNEKDGTREYRLTDPVIHKRRKSKQLKSWNFGRTDRGEKGMAAFWETHRCSDACRMLGLSEQTFTR
jgi:hypothetical protein